MPDEERALLEEVARRGDFLRQILHSQILVHGEVLFCHRTETGAAIVWRDKAQENARRCSKRRDAAAQLAVCAHP